MKTRTFDKLYLIKNKNINKRSCLVIIEPSSSGVELIPAAKFLGYYTIVISYNAEDRIVSPLYLLQADEMIEADTNNFDILVETVKKISQRNNLLSILPGFEYYVAIAAQLNHLMKLRGLPIHTVNCVRYKDQMRHKLKADKIPIPKYLVIDSKENIDLVDKVMGYPCVIKPISGSGSVHVSKVNKRLDLEYAYQNLCEENMKDMGTHFGTTAIVEEFIEGREYSIEGYVHNNTIYFICITEKILGQEPFFVELGHIITAVTDTEIQEKLYNYTASVIKSLNINIGPFHCEVRMGKNGPFVMEVGARLPGDNICELIYNSFNVNLAEIMIKTYVGQAHSLNVYNLKKFSGICFFTLEKNNKFSTIEGLDQLKQIGGFHRFELLAKPGEFVQPPTSSLGRVAKAIFTASNYDAVKQSITQAYKAIKFI